MKIVRLGLKQAVKNAREEWSVYCPFCHKTFAIPERIFLTQPVCEHQIEQGEEATGGAKVVLFRKEETYGGAQ